MLNVLPKFAIDNLRESFHQSLLALATEDGIYASAKSEAFGCIFGRDSAITILKLLRVHSLKPSLGLLEITKRALLKLVTLQGTEFNIESGEQPGKFIHEFRREKYEHLVRLDPPWFVYPDGLLKNYDSIDSTPLTLIALYNYWQITQDREFLITILPAVEAGLNWILTFGDIDKDTFIEYDFPKTRRFGGLAVQSWTDSKESLLDRSGRMPKYPIAPVEAQAFAWLALRLWSEFYLTNHPEFGRRLSAQANKLKREFNDKFLMEDKGLFFAAQALDGDKKQIKTITSNPLIVLWAAYRHKNKSEVILEDDMIEDFVERGFMDDLFVEDAGIRTMSSSSPTFNPNQDSYHNGSFWPMLNGLIIEGLENFQFIGQANKLKRASLIPLKHFGTPIELYIKKDGTFLEFCSKSGQVSCKNQAWSAAAALDFLII
ncbi:hypothetical protein HYW43_00250 [Candidatus Daviesbacteria bacterium]|nr:hypothetical protein [Candidatus Daviesbacteria bacterium]